MTVKFDSEGSVAGSSGCNVFSGSYTDDGTTLSIGPLATTRRACAIPIMQQEQAFLTALQASTQYELTSQQLTLRNPEGAIQVTLLPAPAE
jgi:putative lipoprotein